MHRQEGTSLFAAQRIEFIKEYLTSNKSVDISSLSTMLDVTDVTVRRDLDKLANEGFLIKTHGGAILNDNGADNPLAPQIKNYTSKQQIARTMISLLEENDTVYIGSGSTCYTLHNYLEKIPNLNVITNNASLALSIAETVHNVTLIGGVLRKNNGVFESKMDASLHYLDGVFVNKAILSVDGIDLMAGFTVKDQLAANLFKKITHISRQTIILADDSKFDKIDMYHLCALDQVSCVVTNQCNNTRYKEFFFEANVKLLTSFSIN